MTQTQKKYGLPETYQENPVRTTMDSESGGTYWNPHRLNNAKHYQYAVYTYARDVIRKNGFKNLMDIGCGPAMKLRMIHADLPDLQIIGIDQPHPITFCKENHPFGQWLSDDFENPNPAHKDLKADLILCSDVIEHVVDPDKLLTYIQSRMHKDSLVILSTPDRDRHYGQGFMKSGHKSHIREWNKAEFAQYLESEGWQVLDHFHAQGAKPGLNQAYLHELIYHFTHKRPLQMDYNQVALLKRKP